MYPDLAIGVVRTVRRGVSLNDVNMNRRLPIICVLLFSLVYCRSVYGQTDDVPVVQSELHSETVEIEDDPTLFYLPLEGYTDLYTQLSLYDFSSVRYNRRGYEPRFGRIRMGSLELNDPFGGGVYWPLVNSVRSSWAEVHYDAGLRAGSSGVGMPGQTMDFTVRPADLSRGGLVSVATTDRRYRYSMRAGYASGAMRHGWSYALMVARRWGRDRSIPGVFTDETGGSLLVSKDFGTDHTVTLALTAQPTQTGQRLAATREAFELTGDRLYNPSWGYYSGKVRNSRVRTSLLPMAALAYEGRLSSRTSFLISLGGWTGRTGYTLPGWYDAPTPYPDYYRTMPSYIANPAVREEVAAAWRANDPAVTQVRWDELSLVNGQSDGPASYVLENRITASRSFQGAATVRVQFSERLSFDAGLRMRTDRMEAYKEAKDLLGAAYLRDIDPYLVDDPLYGDLLLNDASAPDRQVREGERYGYHYRIGYREAVGLAKAEYARNRVRAVVELNYGAVSFCREGMYEKQLYPGSLSLGRSTRCTFPIGQAAIAVHYSFTGRHSLGLGLLTGRLAPTAEEVFVSPEYRNETVSGVRAIGLSAAELTYDLTAGIVHVRVSGYMSRTRDETRVYRYYDDLSGVYSDLVLTGLGRRNYGFELAAGLTFSPRWTLNLGASMGRYVYCTDPAAVIRDDASGAVIAQGTRSYLTGYYVGSTPQCLGVAELRYSGTRMWLASVTFAYMGDNYVDLNPVRRMPRVTDRAGSPERFSALIAQERLPSAMTVDLFVSKTFRLGGTHRLTVNASIRNLLNRRDIVYSGYEPMRVRRVGSGLGSSIAPFDTKYYYSYGRGYYAGLSYRF